MTTTIMKPYPAPPPRAGTGVGYGAIGGQGVVTGGQQADP